MSITGSELELNKMYRVVQATNEPFELHEGNIIIPVELSPDGKDHLVAILMINEDDIQEYGIWPTQWYDLAFDEFRYELVEDTSAYPAFNK